MTPIWFHHRYKKRKASTMNQREARAAALKAAQDLINRETTSQTGISTQDTDADSEKVRKELNKISAHLFSQEIVVKRSIRALKNGSKS